MATRSYLSIGEVLVSLKTEFPDVTISKIRFLEGEGLINPERTHSGYRKFYDDDVDRLRKILRMQRDEYLPLKVIKERLVREDGESPDAEEEKADSAAEEEEIAEPPTGLQMSIDEMATATGVSKDLIMELEAYGLISSRSMNGDAHFDGDDYMVLNIIKEFFRYGVEPRHLTMYKHFAEREAGLFEAIVLPMLRQRNPDARRAATESLTELARISRKLKTALLRANLRQHLQQGA